MTQANPFITRWIEAVNAHGLQPWTLDVAMALTKNVGLAARSHMTWRRLNMALGRPPGDKHVFDQLEDLVEAGYIGGYRASRYGNFDGYTLTLPNEAGDDDE